MTVTGPKFVILELELENKQKKEKKEQESSENGIHITLFSSCWALGPEERA